MRDHGGAVEADLQRYYGVDLGALWRGELSLRRLAVLVEYLPVGSATWAAQANVPYGWTLTDVLLTDLFHAFTGQEHPLRPNGTAQTAAKEHTSLMERLQAQRERLARQSDEGAHGG